MSHKPNSPGETLRRIAPHHADTPLVEGSTRNRERRGGVKLGNAEAKLGAFIARLENLDNNVKERALRLMAQQYLITEEEIPEGYWKQQEQLARDNGRGNITLDEHEKHQLAKQLRGAQETSLNHWVNYLEQTGEQYPMWFKIYAFDNMTKLGIFDKSKGAYRKRSQGTVAPYPPLNPAALAKTYDAVKKVHQNGEVLNEENEQKLAQGANFNKVYSHYLLETNTIMRTPENPEDVHGEWREYTANNIEAITQAAEGTPWCIAGEEMAEEYTQDGGRFYLFHLQDLETGQYSRTAAASIRMEGGRVAEISGLKDGSNQYLEDGLVPEVMEKVKTLPGGEKYMLAFEDKQRLIAMDKKFANHEPFTLEEVEFLYEIKRDVAYLDTYTHDPRLEQFRDRNHDLNMETLGQKYTLEEIGVIATPFGKIDKDTFDALNGRSIRPEVIDFVVRRVRPEWVGERIEALLDAGAGIDTITEALNYPAIKAKHLIQLLENGAQIDINSLERELDSYSRLRYIENLIAAGATIDTATLVERNGIDNAVPFLDNLAAVGAVIDIKGIVKNAPDLDFLLSHIDILIRHGAKPDDILDRLLHDNPRLATYHLPKLLELGINRDINDIVAQLDADTIAKTLPALLEHHASIDTMELLEGLGNNGIVHNIEKLQEAGVELNLDDIIRHSDHNTIAHPQTVRSLVNAGADVNMIVDTYGRPARGRNDRFFITELLGLGADIDKVKHAFEIDDATASAYMQRYKLESSLAQTLSRTQSNTKEMVY